MSTDVAGSYTTPRVPRINPPYPGEVIRPQPRGEAELDADTEWNEDWPADDDGDWSGCARDGDREEG
ncbi:hypothetical protein [Methylobacterium sp. E-046]|uniref:hypothetical protein n=1 Tax=Methylobacterium sp. E-046 TaxID=2836576 RepID=UPI001FB9FA30|nr:hypothetical protein [Methylobacterium sp. E-046]MCJ2100029.1 hypothetical protein [Methylobacterium sp. E-046]